MTTMTYTGKLEITSCWCGMTYAIPVELAAYQRRMHDDGRKVPDIFCPLGHTWVPAGRGAAEVEREARQRAERQAANLAETVRITEAEVLTLKRAARAAKRAKTMADKRTAAGVCPCCQRSFVQLARHIAGQHPDFTP